MNKAKKLYCRTFQLGLKTALPFLPYRNRRQRQSTSGYFQETQMQQHPDHHRRRDYEAWADQTS